MCVSALRAANASAPAAEPAGFYFMPTLASACTCPAGRPDRLISGFAPEVFSDFGQPFCCRAAGPPHLGLRSGGHRRAAARRRRQRDRGCPEGRPHLLPVVRSQALPGPSAEPPVPRMQADGCQAQLAGQWWLGMFWRWLHIALPFELQGFTCSCQLQGGGGEGCQKAVPLHLGDRRRQPRVPAGRQRQRPAGAVDITLHVLEALFGSWTVSVSVIFTWAQ